MRLVAVCFAFCMYVLPSFSQSTPSLTKGETIAYLDKKIKECVGHKWKNDNGDIGELVDAKVEKDDKGIRIMYNWKLATSTATSPYYSWVRYVFNPATIKDVAPYNNKTESAVNEMWISLVGNTSVNTSGGGAAPGYYQTFASASKNFTNFVYLSADPDNMAKLKKALLYLKSLTKAEDDPFAN